MHIAAKFGLTPVVQDLITKGSSVYALDENGKKRISLCLHIFSLSLYLTDIFKACFPANILSILNIKT